MSDQNCGNSVQRTYTVEQISKILGISLRKTYYLCEHTTDFKVIRLGNGAYAFIKNHSILGSMR